MSRVRVRRGITRYVIVTKRWAIKLPKRYDSRFWLWWVRGWLANRSEWRQRHRPDVARPVLTLGHLALVFHAADEAREDRDGEIWTGEGLCPWAGYGDVEDDRDERKPSSWGRFGDRWLIIDFDRAWHQEDRGLVGSLYYGRQERMARRWTETGTI